MKESASIKSHIQPEFQDIQFGSFTELSTEFHFVIGDECRIEYINNAFINALGYAGEEDLSYTLSDICHPEDEDILKSLLTGFPGKETIVSHQFRCRFKDGNYHQLKGNFSRDVNTGCVYCVAKVHNVKTAATGVNPDLFRVCIDTAADAVYVIDDQARVVYANEYASTMLGYTHDEFLNLTLTDFTAFQSLEEFYENRERYEEGMVRATDTMHTRKDGSVIPVEVRSSLKSINGRKYSCAIARDITCRKQLDDELRLYGHIVNASSDSMIFIDTDYIYRSVNQMFLDVFNLKKEDVIGKHIKDVFGEEHFDTFSSPKLAQCLKGKEVKYQGSYTNPVSGETLIVDISYKPYRQDNNDVTGVIINAHDVTEIVNAEELLERYEHIVNAATNAMFFVDREYRYLAVNDSVLKSYRLSRDEIIGKTIAEVMGDEHFQTISKPNINKCLKGERVNFQTWFKHPYSGMQFLDVSYIPHFQEDGKVAGVIFSSHNITSLKQAQQELEQSETKLREAQRIAQLGFVEYDLVNDITYWSAETYEIFGVDPDSFVISIENLTALVHPDDREHFSNSFTEGVVKGALDEVDYRIILQDGTEKYIHAQGVLKHNDNNEVVGLFGTVQDITRRKRVELRNTELQFAVENTNDAVYIINRGGEIFYANESACNTTGYSYEELMSKTVFDIDPSWTPEIREDFLLDNRGKNLTFESYHRKKNGKLYPVEVTLNLKEVQGRNYSYAFVKDITDRKEALESLKTSEARFKSLFEDSAIGMAVLSNRRKIIMANAAFYQMLGFTSKEIKGKSPKEFTFEDDRYMHDGLTQQLVDGDIKHYTIDKRYINKQGEIIWGRTTVSGVTDEDNQIQFFIAQIQDVTKEKVAIRQAQELRHAIENSVDAITLADKDSKIYYANKSACEEYGYSLEEFTSLTVYDLDPDASKQEFDDVWEKAENSPTQFERLHYRKDGSVFPVEISSSIFEFEGARYACAFIRNISERKKALRQMEQLEFAMENAADAVFMFNPDGDIFYVNHKACENLQYTFDELTSMRVLDFNPEFPKENWYDHVGKARAENLPTIETLHRRKDGSTYPAEVRVTLREFEGEEFLCGFARDITVRKQEQKQMEELQFAVDNAVDAIFLTRPGGEIFYVNQSACSSLGYSEQELLSMKVSDINPTLTEGGGAGLRDYMQDGGVQSIESIHQKKNGEVFPVELTFKFNAREDDENYSCAIVRDISERKDAEKQMEELRIAIENSNDAIMLGNENAEIYYVNKSACEEYGYTFEEFTTLKIFDIDPSTDEENINEHRSQLVNQRTTIERQHMRKDGSLFPVDVSTSVLELNGRHYYCASVRNISARKDAERQMEELQFAIENSVDGVIIYQHDSSIRYANASLCSDLGYSFEEITSMSLPDIVPALNENNWKQRWESGTEFRERGERRVIEDLHRRKDGSEYPVEVSISYAEMDGITFGFGFIRDITERKRSERQMQKLNFAIENATESVYVLEEDGKINYVNEHVVNQLGYTIDELSGKYIFDIDPTLDEAMWRRMWGEGLKATDSGTQRLIESTHRTRGGKDIPVEISINYAEFQGIIYQFAFVRDITERKLSEQKNEELRFAVDNAIDMIYLHDKDGNIFYANQSACNALGYSYDEITVMNLSSLDPTFSRVELNKRLDDPDLQPIGSTETYHRRKDGTTFPIEVTASSRVFEDNVYICAFVRDITERKRTQLELKNYQEHLEELVDKRTVELKVTQEKLVQKERLALLGQLTGVVSHELRNPLGTIRSSIYILRDNLEQKTGLIGRAISRAERNIVRCDQIIEELLDYARAPKPVMTPVPVDEWLSGIVNEYEFSTDIKVDFSPGSGKKVLLESDRFERCIINILSNACEALQENSEKSIKHLHIQTINNNDIVEIRVIDNGPGISPDILEKIFEPLFSTKGFGVGLGLPIVEQIIQQHNGNVTIDSDVGHGTSVKLILPIVDTH